MNRFKLPRQLTAPTLMRKTTKGKGRTFRSKEEAILWANQDNLRGHSSL